MYVETGAGTGFPGNPADPVGGCRPDVRSIKGEPTVIAVHGTSPNTRIWQWLRQNMVSDCRFVAQNPPRPDNPRADMTPVADLVALIRELDCGPVDLLGWDEGGRIVMHAALTHPELVRSITLYDPSIGEVLHFIDGGDVVEADFLWEVRKIVPVPQTMPTPMPFPAITAATVGKLTIPSLVMTGELSHPRDQIIAEWFVAHMPGARERVWPGLGHLGLLESPEVASEIAAFLAAV